MNLEEFKKLHAEMMRLHYHSASASEEEFEEMSIRKDEIKKALFAQIEDLYKQAALARAENRNDDR